MPELKSKDFPYFCARQFWYITYKMLILFHNINTPKFRLKIKNRKTTKPDKMIPIEMNY